MKMDVEVEIDEKKVLDDMDAKEIFEVSSMDESNCKDFFGNSLLREFSEAEVIEYFGINVAE